MKLTPICLTVVGLMMSGTCVMAANSITTAPTNGVGVTQTTPTNPGLEPANPQRFQPTLAYRPPLLSRAPAVPSVRFLRRRRLTHCHPPTAEDNEAAV